MFHQTAKGWDALSPLGTSAFGIQVSPRGKVWVLARNGLSRLEGGKWRRFTSHELGTEFDFFYGGFVLDREEVWGAATNGVARFDGSRWHLYREAVITRRATSIAAVAGQVWVIDSEGNLSHFDGRSWTIRKLDLPHVNWKQRRDLEGPKLAATANGPTWLVWQGVWRFDGVSWIRVPGISAKAELLGSVAPGSWAGEGKQADPRGALWVRDRGDAVGINVDGSPVLRYKLHDLGLEDSDKIYAVAGRVPEFALATSSGVLWFDGRQWQRQQARALGIELVSNIDVGSDGSVWGIGYPPVPRTSPLVRLLARAMLVLICVVIGLLPAIGLRTWWVRRKTHINEKRMREAVLLATGSVPEDLKENSASQVVAAILTLVLLVGGTYWIVKRYWRDAPGWLLPALLVGLDVVLTVIRNLRKRKPLPSDPIGPGGPPRFDWRKSLPGILGGLAVVPGLAFLLSGNFLFRCYDGWRRGRVERELKQCRYAEASAFLAGPARWPPTCLWALLRAEVLFFSGRAQEAEPILRELIESPNTKAHRARALEQLGDVLVAQRRFSDAQRVFEAATKLPLVCAGAYSGLAELRLRQNLDPSTALADVERALEYRQLLREPNGTTDDMAAIHGQQVWALALLGRASEAQQAIDAGAREADPLHKPELAGLYWRAGMAMLALEKTTAAVAHFRHAAELDPDGYYGKLAAQRLTEHSVWGSVGLARNAT